LAEEAGEEGEALGSCLGYIQRGQENKYAECRTIKDRTVGQSGYTSRSATKECSEKPWPIFKRVFKALRGLEYEVVDAWGNRFKFRRAFGAVGWAVQICFWFGWPDRVSVILAQDLLGGQWETSKQELKCDIKTQELQWPENVKDPIVKERRFKNLGKVLEQVSGFNYQPLAVLPRCFAD